MRAKCIQMFTLNMYIFYFLLLCIHKGLTITTNHHTPLRHEKHYKSSGFQSHQQHHHQHQQNFQHTPETVINEAVHAFHPSNNLHLQHSLQYNSHYMRRSTTTTTQQPYTDRPIRYKNYNQSPFKPSATSNHHQNSLKLHNHSHKQPFGYHTALTTMSPTTTVAPENVYRHPFTHGEHVRKVNKAENPFLTTSKYGTTAMPQSTVLSKPSRFMQSITDSTRMIHSTQRPHKSVYRGSGEQDDYFNEFNGKNYVGSDTFGAKNYREIIAGGNQGKEMNLKNGINDDDDEDNGDMAEDEQDEADDDEEDEYDYLDDESTLEQSGQVGSLTNEKWENYGTREAVDKSRSQIAQRSFQQMAVHNVTAHISRIYTEALCKFPKPKIIPIVATSKTYVPHCTVLHRCGDDTGCCHTDALTCVPKRTATVDLYFYSSYVLKMGSGVKYRRRNSSNSYVKIGVIALISVPVLYLIYNWTRGGNDEVPTQQYLKRDLNEPYVVEGLGNFEPEHLESREGPGENGQAHILSDDKKRNATQSLTEYGMNMVCSDEISLDRSIIDTRTPECRHWVYPYDLPKTSVILVFHNEGLSVLLRTIHSILKRTPEHLLYEILLVDDFSDKANLKEELESKIKKYNGKVRLIRNEEREGLIRTRSRGAREARGEVILFLDAHCEVNTNWLPPLLAPIYRDRRTMTVPFIDGINYENFEYRPVYGSEQLNRGIFEWGMLYKENLLPDREQSRRKHKSEPFRSPTHAGGLFAMNRQYFLELGAYDEGLLVWGGENFELSFKIWQCGGSIEWVPCSRVGHVYRSFMPYSFGKLAQKKKGPLITINYKRVIETWFDDEYKEYFYTREPLAKFVDMGDISSQLELKERLNCKSFDWYMKHIAYDVFDKFPRLPPNLHWGDVRSVANLECLDIMGQHPPSTIELRPCTSLGNNQLMRLNAAGQLSNGERCIEGDEHGIQLVVCKLGTVDGPWRYDEKTLTLHHDKHSKCMGVHPGTKKLSLVKCDPKSAYQQWNFYEIVPKW